MLEKEGGRHTPFFANYQPQFYLKTTDLTGSIKLLDLVTTMRYTLRWFGHAHGISSQSRPKMALEGKAWEDE
jgi:hypothetical protein